MPTLQETESPAGKFAGTTVRLTGAGRVELTQVLHQNTDTSIYSANSPGMVIKVFDLDCGKADEVSYGPYLSYRVELENWEDVQNNDELRSRVPVYYGSDVDYQKKYAFIAMEYLQGQDLLSWCRDAGDAGFPEEWVEQFRAAIFETLTIVKLFHKYGILLIDFKPDNVIRLQSGVVKFVDMGAFFTPRHSKETENYVYSATPDYAELVIDTSNVQTGQPLKQGADIFAAGVALFEMAVGSSRLGISDDCAEQMLKIPEIFLFRDSQIKDIWHAYPHLKPLFPLIQMQLKERQILFSEFWHLLKGYLANQVAEWESITEEQHRVMLLETGTAFISDQLPDALKWLAAPIAQATTLRSFRLGSISDIIAQISLPIADLVRDDILQNNSVVKMGPDLFPPVEFTEPFNAWEVHQDPRNSHWAISTRRLAVNELRTVASFTFLKKTLQDDVGHRFYQIVNDVEADYMGDDRLTLSNLGSDAYAWLGT